MKDAYYFSHDFNARGDEKIVKLRMDMGPKGYGIYWMIVERLYESAGQLDNDAKALAFAISASPDDVRAVLTKYGLFHADNGTIRCPSVDRRLRERKERSEKAKADGAKGAAVRYGSECAR